MNWGTVISWIGVVLNIGASVGYFAVGDIKRGLYFAFAAAITTTVVW